MSSEAETRGYVILGLVDYLEVTLGSEGKQRLPEDLRVQLGSLQRNAWYPIAHFVAPLDLLVEASDGDPKQAEQHLLNASSHMAQAAIGTFLKLLIKVLTPRMFARKLPDFYRHDVRNGGQLVVQSVGDARIDVQVEDIGEIRHMGPIAAGWVAAALGATGQNIEKIELFDWSLENPSPATANFAVHWSS